MPAILIKDVVAAMAERAPLALAESWDNVGLILGDEDRPVARVLTCLTVTPAVVAEAIERGVGLIVSHHPLLFRPVQRINAENAEGRIILDLLRADIAVYSAHTAYDGAAGGINDQWASLLGLENVRPLRAAAGSSEHHKLVVFVPPDHLEPVASALFQAGAGRIGEYSQCSFRTAGVGTFFGSEAANPVIGRKGRREEVQEYRLEVVCPTNRLKQIVQALRSSHPYEEPAFDLYALAPAPHAGGAGRLGTLPEPRSVAELADLVKQSLGITHVGIVGDATRTVQRVALACGSGGEFLRDAVAAQCDAFLTGEARFHMLLEAETAGVALILAGHYATERFAMERLAEQLAARLPDLDVSASRRERDPLQWL